MTTKAITSSGTINSYEDIGADEFGDGIIAGGGKKRSAPPVPYKRFKPNPPMPQPRHQVRKSVDENKLEVPPIGTKSVANGMKIEPKVSAKPPLPPKPVTLPRVKRKIVEDSATLMQKLAAQAEQLRLEVSQLRVALSTERNAVRVLRAQNDSESRRLKTDIKRLQENLQNQKTSSLRKQVYSHQTHQNTDSQETLKLNQEMLHLKEQFKVLEEKYQNSSEAERRRAREINELKDSYEKKLSQSIKTGNVEIQRLLEELKTKERNLNHLKKELSLIKEVIEKNYPLHGAHFSHQMRKLKELEHDISEPTNNNQQQQHEISSKLTKTPTMTTNMTNITTCGEDLVEDQTHEIVDNRLDEVEAHMIASTTSTTTTVTTIGEKERTITVSSSDLDSALSSAPQSLSPQPRSCPDSPVIWPKERYKCEDDEAKSDFISEENEILHQELEVAREQVKELEQELIMLKDDDDTSKKKYKKRMENLEQKEAALIKELHELREQNELLEFRIIELEEAHDKWSIRNTSSTPGTKDVWTDTEKESDDIALSDRSDSGVTSPNSHHHLEDRQSVSPCDLSLLDQISTEDVRKRIRQMSKRACYDEDDKICLLQVLTILTHGESSRDSEVGSVGASSSNDDNSYKPTDSETSHLRSLSLVSASPFKNQAGKIIATVQPYSSSNEDLYRRNSSPQESTSSLKKRSWCSTSLQESGVFEGDLVEGSTQTELVDFPNLEKTNAELCAEIEKLNKFREKVEESRHLPLLPDNCDQRRLQYYKDRLAILENKILIYESSGEQQMKHLADRLQREVQLESIVKQYGERITKLEREKRYLEDERNELEEIENDTRLVNQRLEIEMEVMSQRNIELEISKDTYLEKYQEAKENVACLEECLQKCEERIFVLEEHENDLKHQLELFSGIVPIVGAYCAWKMKESIESSATATQITTISECKCTPDENLQGRINELLNREKELTQNIAELNRAYNETLENADNLWAQMEKDYKERISKFEDGEISLKAKLSQLEERLEKDSTYAQERISHLEESEVNLKDRISKLIKENKEIMAKNAILLEECRHLKEEYAKLRKYIDGPATDAMEKEKKKIKILEDELLMATKMLKHTEEVHQDELSCLKSQLKTLNKELTHTEVTNSELKEEVETLESRIKELARQRSIYEEKIRYLTDELRNKERAVKMPYVTERSLAQELARPVRRNYSSDSSESSRRSTEFLDRLEETKSQRDFRSPPPDGIMNPETRVCRATKRTFVEEAKNRFARWV